MRVLGHKIKTVKPLSDSAAVARGADFLGDAIIYTVASAAIMIEFSRSRRESQKKAAEKLERQARKREIMKRDLAEMNEKIAQLNEKCDMLLAQMREKEKAREQVSWPSLSAYLPRFYENMIDNVQSQQSFTVAQGWFTLPDRLMFRDEEEDEWSLD